MSGVSQSAVKSMQTGTALPRLASVSNSDLDGWIFIYQNADVEHWAQKVESFSFPLGRVRMQVECWLYVSCSLAKCASATSMTVSTVSPITVKCPIFLPSRASFLS